MTLFLCPVSDFCLGNAPHTGPEGTLVSLLEERGVAHDDIVRTAFSYYQGVRTVAQCMRRHPRLDNAPLLF